MAPRPVDTRGGDDPSPRTVVPADIDTPDQIAWGLSFRQLSILAAAGGGLWLAYSHTGTLLPPLVWVAIAIPVLACAIVLALGRRDGLPLDVWLRHGLSMHTHPRRLAPSPKPGGPGLLVVPVKPVTPAPLRPDLTGIDPDGTLHVDGVDRSVIACGTTSITLRTGSEQESLLEGFGRWLNSLTQPAQIVVAAARHDLTPHASAVLDACQRLPDPALRQAATDHAAFLLDLDADREPLRRQVLTVVTGAHARDGAGRALGGLGITGRPMDGGAVTAALSAALDPYNPPPPAPRAVPGMPVTSRNTTQTLPGRRTT
jgi:PrgI family protein